MELKNGVTNQVPPPEVVMGALENSNVNVEDATKLFMGFITMPTTVQVQVNNTVFVYAEANKEHKGEVVCYIYNIDIEKNMTDNILKFLDTVHRRGVTAVTFLTKDSMFYRGFMRALPDINTRGTKAGIGEQQKRNLFVARVVFGDKPKPKKKKR